MSLKCSICCNAICYFPRLPVIGWLCWWVFMNHLLLPEMKHWNNESHGHLFHSKTCRHEATQFSSLIFSKCCITQQGAGRRNCNVMSTDCWCVQRNKLFVSMRLIIGLLYTVAQEVLKWRCFPPSRLVLNKHYSRLHFTWAVGTLSDLLMYLNKDKTRNMSGIKIKVEKCKVGFCLTSSCTSYCKEKWWHELSVLSVWTV